MWTKVGGASHVARGPVAQAYLHGLLGVGRRDLPGNSYPYAGLSGSLCHELSDGLSWLLEYRYERRLLSVGFVDGAALVRHVRLGRGARELCAMRRPRGGAGSCGWSCLLPSHMPNGKESPAATGDGGSRR